MEKKFDFWSGFWEYFWTNFWPSLIPAVPLIVMPSLFHVIGWHDSSLIFFWGLIGAMGLDVVLRLPRFIKAVRNKNSKPYIGWCVVEWSVYGTAILIGAFVAHLVGVF